MMLLFDEIKTFFNYRKNRRLVGILLALILMAGLFFAPSILAAI